MGWKSSFGGLALLLATIAGCKSRVFLTENQLNAYKGPIPADLQENPNVGTTPTIPQVNAPPTLYNLERQIRYLSLAEAVARHVIAAKNKVFRRFMFERLRSPGESNSVYRNYDFVR